MAPRLAHGRTVTGLPQASDAEGERLQLLQATARFLLGAARRTPLAIYINDLHWASRGVADVLAYVAQRVADEEAVGERVPLAILGSYRSDELSGRPVEKAITLLRSRAGAVEVALAPLESTDVADLVYSMLGVDDVPDRFLARIARETAGNPFFVQEIMRALFENGSVFLERGKWATTVDVGQLQMPTTITEVFRRRFALLSVDEQKVVCALAVHGRPLSIDRLAGALANTGTIDALIALEHKGIVIKHRHGGAEYNVAHDHMRETIDGDLSTADRRLFHARLAEELERSASGLPPSTKPIDDLARHFRGADISQKALEYSIAAGTRALEQLSHGSAVDHLSYAVAQLDPHDSRQPVVVEAHADALLRSARFADALAGYARVLSLLPLAEDRARVYGKIADTHEKLEEPERSIDQAWTALELLGESRPASNLRWTLWTLTERAGMLVRRLRARSLRPVSPTARTIARLYEHLANVYLQTNPPRASACTARLVNLTVRSTDPRDRCRAKSVYGTGLTFTGLRSLGSRVLAEAVADGEQIDAPHELGLALLRQEMADFSYKPWRDSLDRSHRSRQLLQRTGDLNYAAGAVAHHGLALLYLGQIAEARAYVRRYRQELPDLGENSTLASTLIPLEAWCVAAMEPGAATDVDAMLKQSRDLAERARNPNALWTIDLAWGECLLQQGRVDEAIAKLAGGLALREAHRDLRAYATFAYWLLPRAYLKKPHRTPTEEEHLAVAQRRARAIAKKHTCWRPPTLVNDALICELHGKWARADQYFTRAVAIARVQQAGWFLASGLYEWGLVLQARGKYSQGTECLREAREIAETGGNVLLLRQCEAALHGTAGAVNTIM
jgi:tetratricopeptide (TPR) repeat protein